MIRRVSRAVISVTLLAATAFVFTFAAHQSDSPVQGVPARLPLADCLLAGVEEPLLCGSLEVPEDRNGPEGRKILLNVVVVPATSPNPRPDAIVEFIGSPGFAATRIAGLYTGDLAFRREDRDVILVDQRGTGGSNPLGCEGVSGTGVSELLERWPVGAVAECRQRLAQNADLAKYTTAAAADDMDAVREWLGYERINVFGGSYGSRAALEYMRRYPSRVRSAVLFGVVPPHFRRPLYYARDGQRAMDILLAECAQDEQCFRTFPALQEELATVLANLRDQPIPVTFSHPETDSLLQGSIDPFSFATVLWEALMARTTSRRVPLIIHRAAAGDFEPFLSIAVAPAAASMPYYEGMHLSVTCPDETLHIGLDEIEQEHVGTFIPSDRAARHVRACEVWEVEPSPLEALEPVKVDVPTLLVSGYMDPVTPPRWAEDVARFLPRSVHIVIRHMSHSLDNDCVDMLADSFFAHPTAHIEVHPCVTDLAPLPFALEP
jgi:pimeloyl-ACP methyl ester carboxylesterase